uniref:Uncharacterized protein n=1 Tax=Timema poppense TaxID=170557 RepID=A0A7R9DRH4_TIMPO|nr:unnamed protein product [Timema poppensis]
MFEERAIILGKLGRHEQALAVYVSVLGNVPKAMEYCDKVYQHGAEEVYVILMKMLISPPDNGLLGVPAPVKTEPDLETALALLEQHANEINPVKVTVARG